MGSCIHNKPKWQPMYWDNLREQDLKITNCYGYAFNVIEKNPDPNNDHKIQPGDISNSSLENDNCDNIIKNCQHKNISNLCGELSFLQSAALIKNAEMNYVNDSAPMHIASSMDAPTTAIFCSTIADFGFGPLASNSKIVETKEKLNCRPCGLHGLKKCPEKHFKCATTININDLLE